VDTSHSLHGVNLSPSFRSLLCISVLLGAVYALAASKSDWSGTLVVAVDSPAADVEKAVQEVTADQIIHGTYSYDKEKTLYGAHAEDSSKAAFRAPAAPGKVFYKVAEKVLAPRNFKDSADIGTITVRYIVEPVSDKRTNLQIDAVFVDASKEAHRSQGAVESSEYAAIRDHLAGIQEGQRQAQLDAEEMARQRKEREAQKEALARKMAASGATGASDTSLQELQISVAALRKQVERRVNAAGTDLKAAPFKSSATLENLKPQAEVVVLILTPYWYGVETEDGHHGWVRRSELEPLP
jgi:hypothetical protein